MEAEGLLLASSEKASSRPEKKVYNVTDKGIEAFRTKLSNLLDLDYRPVFSSDGVFYFSEHLENKTILEQLVKYIQKLNNTITKIQEHKSETIKFIPNEMQKMVEIIFSHHEHHYQAELDWAVETLNNLNQEEISCQNNE